jgi:diacylglycerol kinase family enzyme
MTAAVPGFLIVNPRSGSASPSPHELAGAARARGIRVHVLGEGDDPHRLALEADAEALGVAGGDGSLAAVASAAIERDIPFVCVPFGTRNHFARDIGLDRDDPLGALAAFRGVERRVDVGLVGERIFLNNVSLGLYARLVHRREHHRRRWEAMAAVRALGLAFARRHPLDARVDGEPLRARILLVANNHYRLDLFSLGERDRLDAGELHLYAAEGLFPVQWVERAAPSFRIDLPGPRVGAAVDGEPVELETPLELRVDPGRLRLLVPPGA